MQTFPELDLQALTRTELLEHPRLVHQKLCTNELREQLATALPKMRPYGAKPYIAGTIVLDWDHRLPSRKFILRVYLYTTEAARKRGSTSLEHAKLRISRVDRFPEFDVSQF